METEELMERLCVVKKADVHLKDRTLFHCMHLSDSHQDKWGCGRQGEYDGGRGSSDTPALHP